MDSRLFFPFFTNKANNINKGFLRGRTERKRKNRKRLALVKYVIYSNQNEKKNTTFLRKELYIYTVALVVK